MSETPSEPEATPARSETDAPPPQAAPVQVRLRRAPRYRAFVGVGALLGVIAGIVARVLLGDPGSVFSSATTAGYLAAIGLLIGGLLGGAVAVLVERPHR